MTKNKIGLFIAGIVLFGIAITTVWIWFLGLSNSGELEKEVKRKERELKRYQAQGDKQTPPTREAFILLQKINEKLKMDLKELEKLMAQPSPELPEGTTIDGLVFREKLFTIDKDLHLLAEDKKVLIPQTLGFPEELPDTARVPLVIYQLLTINQVARLFIEEGSSKLSVIKPLELIEHKETAPDRLLFRELPIQIGVECSSETLMSALVRLRNSQQMWVVREVQIKSKDSETIQVNLIISSFYLERSHGQS